MKYSIEKVYKQVQQHLFKTPLVQCDSIKQAGGELYFKMENMQWTGSFKLRGVLSKFLTLKSEANISTVVAASTGNHALAVCYVAKSNGIKPVIFVPQNISESKLKRIRDQGVEIFQKGAESGETEQIAIEWADNHGVPLIHPYNDIEVIHGQGTVGLELHQQLNGIDQVFVPVGGGGLISGIAGYLKEAQPSVMIVGVQPKNACEMAASIQQGKIAEASRLPTISDGTAGGLDPRTITYQYSRDLVDKFILVEEQEIVASLRLMEQHLKIKVEPSAALSLAGIIKSGDNVPGKRPIAIISGGNIDEDRYREISNSNSVEHTGRH